MEQTKKPFCRPVIRINKLYQRIDVTGLSGGSSNHGSEYI